MYTFIFCISEDSAQALGVCERALGAVSDCLPRIGSAPRISGQALPEVSGAYACLVPEQDYACSLLQVAQTEALLVLTFGNMAGVSGLAQEVCSTFATAGAEAVAQMDGNFSALVVERHSRRIWLCGTLLGHRALCYFESKQRLLVSPHDLPLLATGQVPVDIDPVSMASMLACDWSLEGKPLVRGVNRCDPLETVCWQGGVVTRRSARSLSLDDRIDPRDTSGVERQVEQVADHLMQATRRFVAGQIALSSSLTAGMDSRLVWAALAGAAPGREIQARTSGSEASLDVQVARRLATAVGATHLRQDVEPPTAEDFDGMSRLLAFFNSGDTSAKRAMTRLPRLDITSGLVAGGRGGEIFRGFFYPYLGATGAAPGAVEAIADRLVRWRFRRLSALQFADPALRGLVVSRLRRVLARYAGLSGNGHDLVDLLYLLERYARWGAASASLPWNRSWTPFESIGAIRAAFRLPAPIGKYCAVHPLLIRRYLPRRAYWTPINGGQFLALEGRGKLRYFLRQALNAQSLLTQKVRRQLSKSAERPDDTKAHFLNEELGEQVRALVTDAGSLSRDLFGREGVERMLERHRSQRDQLELLGMLLTLEQWRRLSSAMRAASARREHVKSELARA